MPQCKCYHTTTLQVSLLVQSIMWYGLNNIIIYIIQLNHSIFRACIAWSGYWMRVWKNVRLPLHNHDSKQDQYKGRSIPTLRQAVSRLGLVVMRSAGKQMDPGLTPASAHLSLHTFVVNGHFLMTLPCTINETLKWLTRLAVLMLKSLWWWQCSVTLRLPLPSYLLGFWSPSLSRTWHRTLNWVN